MRHGVCTPETLVQAAVAHGQTALALTDRDGLYGAVSFANACRGAGIAPIIGVDLAVHDGGSPVGLSDPFKDHARIVVLARGRQGWAALCRLVSQAHLDAGRFGGGRGKPIVGVADVVHWAQRGDLVVMLGPWSHVGRAVARRRPDLAASHLEHWRDLPSRNVVMEIVNHHAGSGAVSAAVAARMLTFAREHRVTPVLTNAVRYVHPGQAPVADVLDAIRRLVPVDPRHLERTNAQGWLKGETDMAYAAAEAAHLAGDERLADWVLTSTREVAESCLLDPAADLGLGEIHVPELDVLLPEVQALGASLDGNPSGSRASYFSVQDADRHLRQRCERALEGYLATFHQVTFGRGITPVTVGDVHARLNEELHIISELGFAGYFLTVAEVVDLVKEMGIRVAARGSGAGCFVNYLLGISGVDPLRYGLVMERFLSPLRSVLPDIDIDVESHRRLEVYEKILQRFGGERAAAVSMRETYRVRHAIRDVGAALGMDRSDIDALAKAFPHIRARDARRAVADLPELRRSAIGQSVLRGELDHFFSLVEALDGLPRHIAMHPCGVLLSDRSLLDRTPVEASWNGFPMSQFDKDEVEDMGFLKLDVLGIRMQSAMSYAIDEIARVDGIEIDLDSVPLDDSATFELIQSTKTLGCFQIESPGQRELVGKFAPDCFDDLIIDISLFRPGPVKSDMITPFLRARQGWSMPEYLHEDLTPALKETYGVVVFHEQVLKIVSIITGCSLAQADEVRRKLGSPEGQNEVRMWFYPVAKARGYDLATVEHVWDVLRAFASFGFCKAHAAAFALPTYHSAWLKTHHTAAFLAGVLTHDPGMYPKRLILEDARQFGIDIMGLDVNSSDGSYRVEKTSSGYGIRLSLSEVKGIDGAEVARIVAGQPFMTLSDFWHRAAVSRPVVENLVLAGAFDSLYGIGANSAIRRRGRLTRRDLLLQIADLDRWGRAPAVRNRRRQQIGGSATVVAARKQSQAPGAVITDIDVQMTLDIGDPVEATPSGLPEMGSAERVRAELSVLGLDVSHHVMHFYEPMLQSLGITRSADLMATRSKQQVFVAGVKVAIQTPPVRSGRRVVFLTLDDATGPVDATFFEDAQGPYAVDLFHSWLLLVRGEVRRTGPRGVSLRATGCWELSQIYQVWRTGGVSAVEGMVAAAPILDDEPTHTPRMLVHPSGFIQSPYADIKPAGTPPAKFWHSSPGSSGW